MATFLAAEAVRGWLWRRYADTCPPSTGCMTTSVSHRLPPAPSFAPPWPAPSGSRPRRLSRQFLDDRGHLSQPPALPGSSWASSSPAPMSSLSGPSAAVCNPGLWHRPGAFRNQGRQLGQGHNHPRPRCHSLRHQSHRRSASMAAGAPIAASYYQHWKRTLIRVPAVAAVSQLLSSTFAAVSGRNTANNRRWAGA